MSSRDPHPTRRFSDRVADYVQYRPGYPRAVLEALRDATGLTADSVIADVGAGTGISARLFLNNGNVVYAVEPNDEMRAAAGAALSHLPRFHSLAGTAEATSLPAGSVDYVVAAQAFHWFDVDAARREFTRILRPAGWAVLLWNTRRTDATPFLHDYEQLLLTHATDYRQVRHSNITAEALRRFFGPGGYERRSFDNEQVFDWPGLRGRLLSSSYVPNVDQPGHEAMLRSLRKLFEQHQQDGRVRFQYDTEMYFGRLG